MLSEDVVDASIAEILVTLATKSTDGTSVEQEKNNITSYDDDDDDESDPDETDIESLIKENSDKLFEDVEAMRYK